MRRVMFGLINAASKWTRFARILNVFVQKVLMAQLLSKPTLKQMLA
ncbi:hypothetical protein VEx25_0108 [Vibrio antiquarius]|uniref:Transposase n=1 Tax=Vibrio antiquarius (strain Ex25) TaxID=150340 RepID=A0ABM9WWL0_VIBAE|nr:hypothetical protein VEx25_0108 [Vibrio antiquarius]